MTKPKDVDEGLGPSLCSSVLRHWAASVSVNGEHVFSITTDSLCGRELSDVDKEGIRTSAKHLLAFVGDPDQKSLVRFESAFSQWAEAIQTEIATRSQAENGTSVNDYNRHVVSGLEMAYAMMLDAMKRQMVG